MKRITRMGTVLLCCMMLFTSCSLLLEEGVHNGDWGYELPNGYVIWHVNANHIVCGKKKSEHAIQRAVDEHVVSFCYNKQYIALQCGDKSQERSSDRFYLIDTESDAIYGPWSKTEYQENAGKFGLVELSWINTVPPPEGVTYK